MGDGPSSECGEMGRAGAAGGSNNDVMGGGGAMQSELSKGSVYAGFALATFGAVGE